MAREQFQVYQDLVVARAPGVDFLAHVTQTACQHQLHLRVNIFDIVLDDELTTLAHLVDIAQFGQQLFQLVALQQSDTLQHGDMGHRAQHVVLCQVEVHLAVAPYGEALYLLINLKVFSPKFVSHSSSLYLVGRSRQY